MNDRDGAILDVLRDAAFDPAHWAEALDLLAALADATGAALSVREGRRYRVYLSADIDGRGRRPVVEHDVGYRPSMRDDRTRQTYHFADKAYFEGAQADRGAHWHDALLRDDTADDTASTADALGAVHLSFDGLDADGGTALAIEVCDELSQPIVRALALGARGRERAIAAVVDNLALAGVPAAVIDETGRRRAASSRFIAYANDHLADQRGSMRFADRALQNRFVDAMAAIVANGRTTAQSIGVVGVNSAAHFVLHLIPLANDRTISPDEKLIVLVGADKNASIAGVELLKMIFGLTPAESRLTRLLLEGESLETAASKSQVSVMTMRVHLRAIFAKTGVDRQTDLILGLQGLGCPIPVRDEIDS